MLSKKKATSEKILPQRSLLYLSIMRRRWVAHKPSLLRIISNTINLFDIALDLLLELILFNSSSISLRCCSLLVISKIVLRLSARPVDASLYIYSVISGFKYSSGIVDKISLFCSIILFTAASSSIVIAVHLAFNGTFQPATAVS